MELHLEGLTIFLYTREVRSLIIGEAFCF
jgi:hypothetical protein